MKCLIFNFLLFQLFFSTSLYSQVAYFPIINEVLIGPENVTPRMPEQAAYYIKKYEVLADSLELTFKKYKEELKLGIPRTELLLTYRDMRRRTKEYIRLWGKLDRKSQKHQKLASQVEKLKDKGKEFKVKTSIGKFDSDSIHIALVRSSTWEEVTNLLDITEYEEFIIEDNMQWEKVSNAKGSSAKLNGGFQFKKKPYVGYKVGREFEGCLSYFEKVDDACLNSVIVNRELFRVCDKRGRVLILEDLSQ